MMHRKNELAVMKALGQREIGEIPDSLKDEVEAYERTMAGIRGRNIECREESLGIVVYLWQKSQPKNKKATKAPVENKDADK